MDTYSFDSKSLIKNGKRWFPVMGEIHYSRLPRDGWHDALFKMKEGGVDVASTYVIWIHHEEVAGEWDWSGQRDLRAFVETVREVGLSLLLRIGPWCHGEVRNGGFPDWLLQKVPDARATNDDRYFDEVARFYKAVYAQIEGLLLKDGGPIIGVQIDNEFGHCGGLRGHAGQVHMARLRDMAHATGFDVPLYTATGWGGAITARMLPVMGGYCEAPWDSRTGEIEPSVNYVFTHERNDHAGEAASEPTTFDESLYPFLTAELGGGLQVTRRRRPIASGKDIGALSLAKMASGCNLLGYYMYHGGQNPEGKLSTLQETSGQDTGCELNVKNYDFQAALGEYGLPSETYGEIKLLSLFVRDFGESFASTATFIPDSNPLDPTDTTHLRTSWRHIDTPSGSSGYVFVSSYQRRQHMAQHKGVVLAAPKELGDVTFPAIDVLGEEFFFLPFGFPVGNAVLRTALATPLCKLAGEDSAYVFYSAACPAGDVPLQASFVCAAKSAPAAFFQFSDTARLADESIVFLTREDALRAHKVSHRGKDFLLITDAMMFQEGSGDETRLVFQACKPPEFKVYPDLPRAPQGFVRCGDEGGFAIYQWQGSLPTPPCVAVTKIAQNDSTATYKIAVGQWDSGVDDVLLTIGYTGDAARLYEGGKLLDDHFFVGQSHPWQVTLSRYGKTAHELTLEIDALKKDTPVFLEEWPSFAEKETLMRLDEVRLSSFVRLCIGL